MNYSLKFILGMKLYMFRTVPLSIIRSFSLYKQQRYMSYRSDFYNISLNYSRNQKVSSKVQSNKYLTFI